MHAIDDEQAAVSGQAAAVGPGDDLGDPIERQLHTARRRHPRHPDGARLRRNGAPDALDDLRTVRCGARVIQRDVAHSTAGARRRVANRLVMGVVVVFGSDNFLVGTDAQTVIRHRQRRRRVGRQTDFRGITAHVAGQRPLHRGEGVSLRVGEGGDLDPHRVGVEFFPEAIDGLGHGLRVRDEQKAREVRPVGRERKELADGEPVHRTSRRPHDVTASVTAPAPARVVARCGGRGHRSHWPRGCGRC